MYTCFKSRNTRGYFWQCTKSAISSTEKLWARLTSTSSREKNDKKTLERQELWRRSNEASSMTIRAYSSPSCRLCRNRWFVSCLLFIKYVIRLCYFGRTPGIVCGKKAGTWKSILSSEKHFFVSNWDFANFIALKMKFRLWFVIE